MEDKEQLHCYISRDVLQRLREIVVRENGFFVRGMISQYVEKAIRRQMGGRLENKAAHTHHHFDKKIKLERAADEQQAMAKIKATEFRDKVVRYLTEQSKREKEPRIKVGITELRGAISAISGVNDNRSIRNRITLLRSGRLISQPDPQYEIYEISTGYHPDLDSKSKEELK